MGVRQLGWVRLVVRLPPAVRAYVIAEATLNGSSQNSEIVRALRERMTRAQEEKSEAAQDSLSSGTAEIGENDPVRVPEGLHMAPITAGSDRERAALEQRRVGGGVGPGKAIPAAGFAAR